MPSAGDVAHGLSIAPILPAWSALRGWCDSAIGAGGNRCALPRCCGRWPNMRRWWEAAGDEVMTAIDHEMLIAMLDGLKLTAIRDQLDTLLDEAARSERPCARLWLSW